MYGRKFSSVCLYQINKAVQEPIIHLITFYLLRHSWEKPRSTEGRLRTLKKQKNLGEKV